MHVMTVGLIQPHEAEYGQIAHPAALVTVMTAMVIGYAARQWREAHVHIDELRHQHQRPVRARRVHDVQHVHVHRHGARSHCTTIAATTPTADDGSIVDGIVAVQHGAALR